MGIKYHLKGIGKNKDIKKERKKPLPLQLMIDNNWYIEKESYLRSLDETLRNRRKSS